MDDTSSEWIREKEMPASALQLMWTMSNNILDPFVKRNKMGVVLLQFHTTFKPTKDNIEYVINCRKKLRSDVRMAIEFRNRSWLHGKQREKTAEMLRSMGSRSCGLVASDDLEHEVQQRDRAQSKTFGFRDR